jgi:voltage-gated potassium channel
MTEEKRYDSKLSPWQNKIHEIIYEHHTAAGKAFDVVLLIMIVLSIIIVMLDSVNALHGRYGNLFYIAEWVVTILFTLEYILRIITISKPSKYIFSFLGIIDLIAIIPTYLSIFFIGSQTLIIVRALRLLRIFRIFKLQHYMSEMQFLYVAVANSLRKISIFLLFVLTIVVIMGSVMYLIEGSSNGFTSIPQSIYWAIVTITTVGYGDISPVTTLGKVIASLIMLLGYGLIAVPTGIVSTEMAFMARAKKERYDVCTGCGKEGHEKDAIHCKICGTKL